MTDFEKYLKHTICLLIVNQFLNVSLIKTPQHSTYCMLFLIFLVSYAFIKIEIMKFNDTELD